jgi:hypothetical protein
MAALPAGFRNPIPYTSDPVTSGPILRARPGLSRLADWPARRPPRLGTPQQAVYVAACGSCLLMLKPNSHEALDELAITEVMQPDDIERLRAARRREEEVTSLEILDDAAATTSSLEVGPDGQLEAQGFRGLGRSLLEILEGAVATTSSLDVGPDGRLGAQGLGCLRF